jgi:Alpha-glutamyl/putrescinyl thymine pyrophosphorylase clade 2
LKDKQLLGRGSPTLTNLKKGMDFRKLEYRREVFLNFYEFHLRNGSHPGGVYFAMPWLADYNNMNQEQMLWMAFINGCSQNIVSTHIIMKQFPRLENTYYEDVTKWWNDNHIHFKAGSGWDSDRKYFKIGKTGFPECVASYKKLIGNRTQTEFFGELCKGTPYENFRNVWNAIKGNVLSMGRLSTFSYLEYLRICGLPIDCDSLFLDDISGSKSHRNGLCKVLGRDDLDDYEAENPDFPGYHKDTIKWLEEEGEQLLRVAKSRIDHKDVSYFTLESTLCCYKSWHRPNRRYPNVYMDMMYNRIKYAEQEWGDRAVGMFWQMRKECLPKELRLEDNPNDPGLSKVKQNHYRLTGQPIMMSQMFPVYENDFDKGCWSTSKQGLEEMFE